jgi:hypothetical protein
MRTQQEKTAAEKSAPPSLHSSRDVSSGAPSRRGTPATTILGPRTRANIRAIFLNNGLDVRSTRLTTKRAHDIVRVTWLWRRGTLAGRRINAGSIFVWQAHEVPSLMRRYGGVGIGPLRPRGKESTQITTNTIDKASSCRRPLNHCDTIYLGIWCSLGWGNHIRRDVQRTKLSGPHDTYCLGVSLHLGRCTPVENQRVGWVEPLRNPSLCCASS